jgi:hypothetical protein
MFTQVIRTGFVGARKLNQIMPWHAYRGMTDEDFVAMFAYMRTLKPVRHNVDNTAPRHFARSAGKPTGAETRTRCTCHSRSADSGRVVGKPETVQKLAKRGATNTGQDDSVLDNAFALIEGFEEINNEFLGSRLLAQNSSV